MQVINKERNDIHYRRRDFGSFDEYLSYAQSPLPADVQEKYADRSTKIKATEEFHGGTYEQAMDRANKGWQEGWEVAKKMSNMFRIDLGETALRKKTIANYHGQRVNMGNYLANNPRNMNQSRRKKLKRPGKIVKIFVHGGMLSNVNHRQIINRGATVLALVEALELSGYRVQINSGSLGKCPYNDGFIDLRYPLKSEDQPIDKDRLGFCLVSPSMHRVVGFSAREHEPLEWHKYHYNTFGGQGGTKDYTNIQAKQFVDFETEVQGDIYIGVNNNDWKTFNTEESSKAWLKQQFETYGVKTDD